MWNRNEIVDRLDLLRRTDPEFMRFGAEFHRYVLNRPLTESTISTFESRYDISLPAEYRSFIRDVGDGGAGPFLGLFRLDRSELHDPDDEDTVPGFLAGEFPHPHAWNDLGDGGPEAEDAYFDPAQIRGSLCLSHQGCGYMVRLVLNGPQRGTLWEDGRCSDMGITPFAPDFRTWYLTWLNTPRPA